MLTSLFYGAELTALTVGLGSILVSIPIAIVTIIKVIIDIKKQTTRKWVVCFI